MSHFEKLSPKELMGLRKVLREICEENLRQIKKFEGFQKGFKRAITHISALDCRDHEHLIQRLSDIQTTLQISGADCEYHIRHLRRTQTDCEQKLEDIETQLKKIPS